MKKLLIFLLFIPILAFGQKYNIKQTMSGNSVVFSRGITPLNPNAFYNVLSYGADPTGAVNSDVAFQAAIDAAQDGTVFIPSGIYKIHNTLTITYATNITGVGWSSRSGNEGTILKTIIPKPVFKILNATALAYSDGARISNLMIYGNSHADSSGFQQTGMKITTEGNVIIDRVTFYNCGDYGIRLGGDFHTTKIEISNCHFEGGVKGGIYGRYLDAQQVNAIRITGNEINGNTGFGINLLGCNVIIQNNIIQDNDSSGIFMSARDLGNVNLTSANTLISGNWIEENRGGNILIEIYYDSSPVVIQFHTGIEISNNTLVGNQATIIRPGITALVNVRKAYLSEASTPGIKDFHLRSNNYYSVANGMVCFDGQASGYANSLFDYSSIIEFPSLTVPFTYFVHLGAMVIVDNRLILASLTDGTPTDSEIDAAIGTTPAVAGVGYRAEIQDSDGSALRYSIRSDGTNWQYTVMIKAV